MTDARLASVGGDGGASQGQLLATKLYTPGVRPDLLGRPRLIQRLERGLQTGSKLTLISAPAGFGKTTLLAEWIQSPGGAAAARQAAWVSLDEGDNEPARFLSYLTASLESLELPVGEGILGALLAPQPPPIESVLTALINEGIPYSPARTDPASQVTPWSNL
jgi:LuxR family maltose regulon positive regulatory protein